MTGQVDTSEAGGDAIEVSGVREAIRRRAAGQFGLITRDQLRAAGVPGPAIDERVRSDRLRVVHRGVYLLGPVMPPGAQELAAVLAFGDRAYVSHASAAHLHRLLPLADQPAPIHVTVAERSAASRDGIHVHRVLRLDPDEVGTLAGIPITSPARTILDLAATLAPSDLEQLVAEAYANNLASRDKLLTLIARHHRRPGTPALGKLLEGGAPAFTRSEAERRFLALIRRAELPRPQVNARLHGYEVDFLWPAERVVVEVDGHAFHASRPQRERDSRRDQDLTLRGYTVLRITWRQITAESEALVARVAAALARGGSP